MEDQKILKALSTLKTNIDQFLVSIPDHASDTGSFNAELNFAVNQAQQRNQWFTRKNIIQALSGINFLLNTDALIKWINRYDIIEEDAKAKQVGIIMAGNIPMVGFHDLMCVILSGHKAVVKLSDDDTVLMQFIINALIKSEPDLINQIGRAHV